MSGLRKTGRLRDVSRTKGFRCAKFWRNFLGKVVRIPTVDVDRLGIEKMFLDRKTRGADSSKRNDEIISQTAPRVPFLLPLFLLEKLRGAGEQPQTDRPPTDQPLTN